MTEDEREDASFRLKDCLWAKLVEAYQAKEEKGETSYRMIAERAGKLSEKDVELVLTCVHYITLENASLIAECMDVNILVSCVKRRPAGEAATDDVVFSETDLSPRLRSIMKRNGFVTVADVKNLSRHRYMRFRLAGSGTMAELEAFLGRPLSDAVPVFTEAELEGKTAFDREEMRKAWDARN